MVNSPSQLNSHGNLPPLWKRLAEAFPHRYAIVSEAELLAKLAQCNATTAESGDVIEWCKEKRVIAEAADQPGCIELTPQGRRLWRELMGEI